MPSIAEQIKPKKGKQIKHLTLPQTVAKNIEQIAKDTDCKQADIVKVAICELNKCNEQQLTQLLIDYQIY